MALKLGANIISDSTNCVTSVNSPFGALHRVTRNVWLDRL